MDRQVYFAAQSPYKIWETIDKCDTDRTDPAGSGSSQHTTVKL